MKIWQAMDIDGNITAFTGYKPMFDHVLSKKKQTFSFLGIKAPKYPIWGAAADFWSAFQTDQKILLQTCRENIIENVIFVSGDTHIGAIDDGCNAGFPASTPRQWPGARRYRPAAHRNGAFWRNRARRGQCPGAFDRACWGTTRHRPVW